MKHPLRLSPPPRALGTLAVLLALLLGAHIAMVAAQAPTLAINASQGNLALSVGDILDLLAVRDDPTEQFTWVLEKDGTFMQAAREQSFRARFTDAGTYALSATVVTADGAPLAQRSWTIAVRPRPETASGMTLPSGSGAPLATEPPLTDGTVMLPAGRDILKIIPDDPILSLVTLDLDPAVDDNGDGDPRNDDDAPESFIRSGKLPLFLWLVSPKSERTIVATTMENDGSLRTQEIRIVQSGTQAPAVPAQESAIAVESTGSGALRFTLPGLQNLNVPTLSYWTFGDGTESLGDAPMHRYEHSGTYDVRVRIVDLRTGQAIFEAVRSVAVNAFIPTGSSSSAAAQASSAASSASAGTVVGSAFLSPDVLKLSIRIFLVLLGAIVLGGIAAWLIGVFLRRESGLQSTLEAMESKLVKPEGAANNVIDVAPPLKIRRAEQPEEPPAQPAPAEEPPPPPPLPVSQPPIPPVATNIDVDNAPSWLRKGLEKREEAQPVAEPPPPLAPQPPPMTPIAPPPSAQEPPQPASETPAWLRNAQTPPPTETAPKPVSPAPALPSTPEQDERERERKRLKRKRYRENLKKRKQEQHAVMPPTKVPEAPVAPPAPPVESAPPMSAPVAPPPAPAEVPAAPEPPVPAPAAPAMPAPTEKNEETKPGDDDIVFVVEAEGVKPEQNPDENQK